jgi:hypothetical protein
MKELKLLFGYSKYGVTKDGEVWSYKMNRLLKPQPRGNYLKVTLYNDKGQRKQLSVHRIVAEIFCNNPDPKNKTYINHINGDKYDNRSINLEWVTAKENSQHAVDTGLMKGNPTKLGDKQKLVFKLLNENWPHDYIAKETGISKSMISSIKCGYRWKEAAIQFGFKSTKDVGRGKYTR